MLPRTLQLRRKFLYIGGRRQKLPLAINGNTFIYYHGMFL